MTGHVVEINIAPREHELPQPVERVAAHAGKGLEGNRYYFDDGAEAGRAITLIEAEAIAGMAPSTASRSQRRSHGATS
jgi:hypothetical protein